MINIDNAVDALLIALDKGNPPLTKLQCENIANACNGAAYLLDKNPFMENVGNIALEWIFGETPPSDCVEVAVMGALWVTCYYVMFGEQGYAGRRSRDAFLEAGQIMIEYGEQLDDDSEELDIPNEWSSDVDDEIEKELYDNSDDDWDEDTSDDIEDEDDED